MPQVGSGVSQPRASQGEPQQRSACIIAKVTNSASVNSGAIPIPGRHGANPGESLNMSSVFT
jgi:hypothetical protein